ncbi:hypothetical protein QSH18_12285 [Xanthomonas sp. NCPPB 2654]|uniref:hypothetical protein n=1 Tax=unclassified Xanthomonas TaxID=2643310 RepID=UPI0021E0D2FA|nr:MULTISPECIES: hypothetical protein [unclassified Xanthomonas]MDL5366387.1 hypothetical protein [Xanthomonas sp. NCPPB 2654]UYC22389.1 hypothetical protein NUG20_08930 [Xanthomonas sp. CFBP 8443]
MSIVGIYFGVTFGLAVASGLASSALFYGHVLTGLADRGQRLDLDFSVVPFRRQRYVERYLALLTPQERRTLANLMVRHLPWVTPTLGLLCLVGTFCIGVRWG